MLMSRFYFVHRVHSPHLDGGVGNAATSAASWVDTWQGSRNSTLTVLRMAAQNVRWILFGAGPIIVDLNPARCSLTWYASEISHATGCTMLRERCPRWTMRSQNGASLFQRLQFVG